MKCPCCGAAELIHDTRDMPYTYKGETTTIPAVTGDFCPACGEVILSREHGDRYGELAGSGTHRAELRARYPAILERASLSYGPGWAGLMEALCERLEFHADHNAMPPVQVTQAKEKFGELVVLYLGGDRYAGGLIDMAEALSAHVCELCGNAGALQEGPPFRTRCPEHVDTRLSDYLKKP